MHRSILPSHALALAVFALALSAAPAHALEMSARRLEVAAPIDAKAGAKLATDLMKLNEAGAEPVYLLITASGGSAQGVLLVADAIRAVDSPVVAVVMTPVHGAAAALSLFADRLVMLPSSQLVFTEVDYEGVAKPADPKTAPPDAKPPTAAETFLHKVRADYLQRFWDAVAKRLNEKSGVALMSAIERDGGRVVSAEDALKKKIAFEIASSLVSERVASEKTELKVITTRTETKTVPPAKTAPQGQ